MQNAIEALNWKADAYLVKPVDVDKLLQVVAEQLEVQKAERSYSEEKVVEFIAARVAEISKDQNKPKTFSRPNKLLKS